MPHAFRLAWNATSTNDLREAVEVARRLKVEGLTVGIDTLPPDELSQTGRREVRSLIARNNLSAAALRADAPGQGLTADTDADRLLARLESAMILARDCGFGLVACDLGRLPRSESPTPPPKPIDPAKAGAILLPDMEQIQQFTEPARPLTDAERRHTTFAIEVLRAAGGLADRIGIPVAFSAALARAQDLMAVLRVADVPLFARELDPSAVLEEGPVQVVAMEPFLLHVRGRDGQRGAGGKTRSAPVGEGDVDWRELFAALADADFRGFISVEGDPRTASAAITRLRDLLE